MKSLIWISFLFALFACQEEDNTAPTDPQLQALQNLKGTYQDLQPYPYGEAFGQRIFTFDEGKWTLDFTLGLDPALEQAVFTFRTYGTFTVLEPSTTVASAYNALFLEEKKFLTLETDNPQLAAAFGLAECGLEVGIEKDISMIGCSLWAPVSDCNEDHDLLKLTSDGKLHFGVRPADNNMCTPDRRPTALTPAVTKL